MEGFLPYAFVFCFVLRANGFTVVFGVKVEVVVIYIVVAIEIGQIVITWISVTGVVGTGEKVKVIGTYLAVAVEVTEDGEEAVTQYARLWD